MFFRRLLLLGICWLFIAGVAAAAEADHLLISEVLARTRTPLSSFGSPFVEIVNPTDQDCHLGDVYLSNGNWSNLSVYWNIVLADPQNAFAGGGDLGAFHVHFPDGAILTGGDTLAISLNGSGAYFEAFGQLPDFELFEDGSDPDQVPEMVEAFPGSVSAGLCGGDNVPALSPTSESLILYTWDGSSDLVQDLDYVFWGTSDGVRVDKTGVVVGSNTYLPETAIAMQTSALASGAPSYGRSLSRLSADEGSESVSGGNGLTGHDETSENLADSWEDNLLTAPGHGVPAAPDEFFPSAPIFCSVNREFMPVFADQASDVLVEVKSFGPISSVDLFYSIEGQAFQQLVGSHQGGDFWNVAVPGLNGGQVVSWYCRAIAENGRRTTWPADAPNTLENWQLLDHPKKVLISEVSIQPAAQEFIEIYNPGDEDIDLSNYYLTDATYSSANTGYWNLGAGSPSYSTIGGGDFYDFEARFPSGYILAAGDTITISIAGSHYFNVAFGANPDLELFEEFETSDAIPDMRPVFENATGNSIMLEGIGAAPPSLTNGGESVVLYYWEEGLDLVIDIDMFAWGPGGSYQIDKTDISVGSSTYRPDTPASDQHLAAPISEYSYSYQRIDAQEGSQIQSGSNGIFGQDETSENWSITFAILPTDPVNATTDTPQNNLPQSVVLLASYPNPFNPVTNIHFELPTAGEVELNVYDLAGRKVRTLHSGQTFNAGRHVSAWNGTDDQGRTMASGVYHVRLKTDGHERLIRVTLVK